MLTRLYVEALLADKELADQVWELWNAGVISDELAALAWSVLATSVIADSAMGVHGGKVAQGLRQKLARSPNDQRKALRNIQGTS